jgi:hypothetical protein
MTLPPGNVVLDAHLAAQGDFAQAKLGVKADYGSSG